MQPTSFDSYNNDIAPIGEVVRTVIEGDQDRSGKSGPIFDNLRDLPLANSFPSSPKPSDPTPTEPTVENTSLPIQIDLVNGDGDIDLTNGLDSDQEDEDIDLTGTTLSTPTQDTPLRLFDGYEDVEYDPSEYEYLDDYSYNNADDVVDLLGVNGINSGAPNFGIPGTNDDDDDAPYSVSQEDDSPYSVSQEEEPRRGKEADPRFVPAEYVDDGGEEEFLEYTELLSEGQELDKDGGSGRDDDDVAFISVPLKIEELGGEASDSRNCIDHQSQVFSQNFSVLWL